MKRISQSGVRRHGFRDGDGRTLVSPRSQSGIALVITLILLSVITFMAVTFLVMSRRGGEQTSTFTQQVIARQAADAALEQFNSRFGASIMGRTNGYDFGLFVSTNFLSPWYEPGSNPAALTNVNFYYANGQPLSQNDQQRMLANQLMLPRPPVYLLTNKAFPNALDFRFYLDLNRNGIYDPSGSVWLAPGIFGPVLATNQFGLIETNHGGDPEWIGILEHPDQPHSSSNRYIGRYCYIAVPVGNSLDFNAIHNHAVNTPTNISGFLRNEGVGSWEINLAGFFAGLNPNMWNAGALPYSYDTTNTGVQIASRAFTDATSILQYRYNGTYNNLGSFSGLYGVPATIFNQIGIDGYSVGPMMTNFSLPPINESAGTLGWSGANNPNHFYTSQDYFTILTGPNSFAANLRTLGLNVNNNFDRYTYYRMLSQMGTDTAPEDTNKLNLNFVNIGGLSATNFVTWSDPDLATGSVARGIPAFGVSGALMFFTSAADRLLKTDANLADLSITNIPIYPFNRYTPAVHRMVQLAANIYDATQNKATNAEGFDYPSVFRPTFGVSINGGFTNIYINGYEEVPSLGATPATSPYLSIPMVLSGANFGALSGTIHTNVYGIPWVIGARRGFPNFNQFATQETYSITRKVQIVKPTPGAARSTWHTNIQYGLSLSNNVAVEAWNSYLTVPRPTTILGADNMSLYLTNGAGVVLTNITFGLGFTTNINGWPVFPTNQNSAGVVAQSFKIPLDTNVPFLPGAVFHPNGTFTVTGDFQSAPFDTTTGYPLPLFDLNVTNRLRFWMVDTASGRVIDCVLLDGMTSQQDLTAGLRGNDTFGPGGVWDTNRVGGGTNANIPILGIENQVQASLQNPPYTRPGYPTPVQTSDWLKAGLPAGFSSVAQAVQSFNDFYQNNTAKNPNLTAQVPYTPTRTVSVYFSWQANDPLVHYTLADLTGLGDFATPPATNYDKAISDQVAANLSKVNKRYLTWAATGARNPAPETVNYEYNVALMDPQITRSDDWSFPTNFFPNIGWLGRVHRGTPWQTVYMKSPNVDHALWVNWTGNSLSNYFGANGLYDDSQVAQPVNDRAIFDLFTTAPNDNATRGQLPVNQTNFAAWAALLDGVIVMTNDPAAPGNYGPWVIDPNVNPTPGSNALFQIVADINNQRATFPGSVFTRLGDVLSTPSLTMNSPFLNTNGLAPSDIPNDFAYERLPQQVMSLLRVGSPRYVVYAYGQSLKPAANSLVTGGPFFQLCTNYQITGEVVTRTVVRFEPSQTLNALNNFTPLNPTRNPAMPRERFGPNASNNRQPPPRAVIESFTVLPPE